MNRLKNKDQLSELVNFSNNNSGRSSFRNKKHFPKPYNFSNQFSSLAEQNKVKQFNKINCQQNYTITNEPQRIQLPLFFNTPNRKIQSLHKPPTPKKKYNKINLSNYYQQQIQKQKESTINSQIIISTRRRLTDYLTLAFACRRSGKVRDQGRAYFSIGVLYDNVCKYKIAIKYYQKFLQICKNIGDNHGQALAYNCIGVNYQLLAQKDKKYLQDALSYHKRHENIADLNSKFLAQINIGLCYESINDSKNSVFYFQNALKHAIKMSNVVGQCMAIGNIGRIGIQGLHDNRDKMKIFIEKYIKLSHEMKDQNGEAYALFKMGLLSGSKKNYEQGKQNFYKALKMAQNMGQKYFLFTSEFYNDTKCGYAVVNAESKMKSYLNQVGSSFSKVKQ